MGVFCSTHTAAFWLLFSLGLTAIRAFNSAEFDSVGCSSSSIFTPTNVEFEFSKEIVDYAMTAAELSQLTNQRGICRKIAKGNHFGFDKIQSWWDINDLSIVAERDGICYAAFRGTVAVNPFDMWQLFDSGVKMVNGCKVRAGFYNAYRAFYYRKFRAAIADCMTRSKELVLTGQSQGGSNAIVAHLDLQEYNPITISFGALRTLVEKCDTVDTSRHYRFVNVGYGFYDEWCFRFQNSALHFGHLILLDSSAKAPACYLGLDDNKMRSPQSRDVHAPFEYWDGLQSMLDGGSCGTISSIRISGWENGHWCNDNDECDSGVCEKQICVEPLEAGE